MRSATVNCDASFCQQTRAAGWACWIAIDGGRKVKRSGLFHTLPKSAAEAEYWAMLNGIWIAAKEGATVLLVQSDCQEALRRLAKGCDERKRLYSMLDPVSVRGKWVKAHKRKDTPRHWVNDWCDKTAKRHMRGQRKTISNKG